MRAGFAAAAAAPPTPGVDEAFGFSFGFSEMDFCPEIFACSCFSQQRVRF